MPVRHSKSRSRSRWTERHLIHLLTGHDWGGIAREGFGHLYDLPDDELIQTVASMLLCWREKQREVTAEYLGLNHMPGMPWFARYADEPETLLAEVRKHQAYRQAQWDRGGYFPYAEFVKTYKPEAASCPV